MKPNMTSDARADTIDLMSDLYCCPAFCCSMCLFHDSKIHLIGIKCHFTITLHKEFELDWFILDKITL